MTEQTKAFTGELSQAETNYIPLSATKGKACANCRWFEAYGDCYIVEDEPEPILATGYCDRHETAPEPPQDATEALAEAIVEAVTDSTATISEAVYSMPLMGMDMGKEKKSFTQRLKDLLTPKPKDDAFSVFKGVDGKWQWHSVHTNNFEDLEGEILTEKAHDNYVTRVDMGLVPMPVLQAWHTPGSEHGEADIVWRNGHFVHALGHFYDTPQAEKAIAFYRKNAGKIKMSHGFTAPEWAFDGKHYDDYNTIEITTLPPYAAANPYTSFEELMTMQKTMTDEKRRYLEAVVGKDKAAEIVASDELRGKALEDMKVSYKDHAAVATTDAPAQTENEKALSAVYGELATGMNELVTIVSAQAKELKAKDTEIAQLHTDMGAWQKELNDLRVLMNQPPRLASQDASTLRTADEATTLKDKLPTADPVANFFGAKVKA